MRNIIPFWKTPIHPIMVYCYFFSAFFLAVLTSNVTPFNATFFSSEDYKFEHPKAITTDLEGNAWVRSGDTVTKIPFTSPQIPVVFTAPNYRDFIVRSYGFSYDDICSDSKGNIWFTDSNYDRVIVIPKANPNNFIVYYGQRYSSFYFSNPKFIVIDSKDNVWVACSGSTIAEISNGTIVTYSLKGYVNDIYGLAIDSKDNLWAANRNFGVTLIPASNRKRPVNYIGTNYGYDFLIAITTDPYDNVWVLSSSTSTSSTDSQYVLTQIPEKNPWSPIIYSGPSFKFDQPQRIASDLKGNIWVTNTKGNSVTKVPIFGNPIVYSDSRYHFGGPSGITVDYVGNIWITNDNIRSVTKFPKAVDGQNIVV